MYDCRSEEYMCCYGAHRTCTRLHAGLKKHLDNTASELYCRKQARGSITFVIVELYMYFVDASKIIQTQCACFILPVQTGNIVLRLVPYMVLTLPTGQYKHEPL